MSGDRTSDYATNDFITFIQLIIDSRLVDMFTALPGTVVSIKGNMVDVQISIDRLIKGKNVDYPLLVNIPIKHFAASEDQYIQLPITKGTPGLIIFSQRSLDVWKDSNGKGIVDPANNRWFDISDAIFLPGLLPKGRKIANTENIEIRNKLTKMRYSPKGTFEITGKTGGLVNTLETLTKQITTLNNNILTFNTAVGTFAGAATTLPEMIAGAVVLATACTTLTTSITQVTTDIATTTAKLNGMKL